MLQVLLADLREYRRDLYIVRWICQHIDWKICQNAELFLKNILNHILRITQGRSYGHIKNYRWREITITYIDGLEDEEIPQISINEKEEYFIVMPNARKIFKCFKGEN